MDNEIKISVVIPTCNSGGYIEKTLDTVCAQTVLPYEVLIIDDGSKDDTLDVIRRYTARHQDVLSRVRIFTQQNQGAGAARNTGIRNAKGNWISFLDSDDLWHPKKLEHVMQAIRSHRNVSVISHDEYAVHEGDLEKKKLCPLHKKYDPSANLFVQLYQGNLFSTSCMTVRTSLIKKAGCFDVSLLSAQDYDLWIRIGMYGKLCWLNEPLETYVTRDGNISSHVYRRYGCEMKICRKYIPYLRKQMPGHKVKGIVRKRIFKIHKVNAYQAICNRQIPEAFKICLQLPVELMRKI